MSFLDRISAAGQALFGRYGPSASFGSPNGWFFRMLGGKTKAGIDVNEFTALRLPVVFACVNRIANPLSSFPLKIYQRLSNGGASVVTEHPMRAATSIDTSSMSGNVTSTSRMSRNAILSLMVRSHAMWL